jgi:hypothetical protein
VVTGRIGFAHGGMTLNVNPASIDTVLSDRGMIGNGVHIGGGFGPAYAALRACRCMSMIGARSCAEAMHGTRKRTGILNGQGFI